MPRRVTRHFAAGGVGVDVGIGMGIGMGVGMGVGGVAAGDASFTQRKPRCSSEVSGGVAIRALGR
jgi:hypothetical protein